MLNYYAQLGGVVIMKHIRYKCNIKCSVSKLALSGCCRGTTVVFGTCPTCWHIRGCPAKSGSTFPHCGHFFGTS